MTSALVSLRRADRGRLARRKGYDPLALRVGLSRLDWFALCSGFEILRVGRGSLDAGYLLAWRVKQTGLNRPPDTDRGGAKQGDAQEDGRERASFLGAGKGRVVLCG
jgi:hypothetical protein